MSIQEATFFKKMSIFFTVKCLIILHFWIFGDGKLRIALIELRADAFLTAHELHPNFAAMEIWRINFHRRTAFITFVVVR